MKKRGHRTFFRIKYLKKKNLCTYFCVSNFKFSIFLHLKALLIKGSGNCEILPKQTFDIETKLL